MFRYSIVFAITWTASAPAFALRVDDLRCESSPSPLGIDEPHPLLSWRLMADERAVVQRAYQVRVATSRQDLAGERRLLWDSGRVAGSRSTHVPYTGRPLRSEMTCWWQVRVWDQDGRPSAWSKPARWTMGLLRKDDWLAQWIEPPAFAADGENDRLLTLRRGRWIWLRGVDARKGAPPQTIYFRRRFDVPADAVVVRARAVFAVDDQFTLHVNGRMAGQSDGKADAWKRPVSVNLTSLIRTGANAVAIEARNTSAGPAGLVGRIVIELRDRPPIVISSDGAWKASADRSAGWTEVDFAERGWRGARQIARMGQSPWGALPGTGPYLPPAAYLRREFRVTAKVRRATLYATALGFYEPHLDGRPVSQDVFRPGWTDYHRRIFYQTYDLSGRLAPGAHALGAILADGWYAGYVGLGGRERYGDRPCLLMQLHIEYEDGSRQVVSTDQSWRASDGPIREADLLMGQVFDARRSLRGWDTAGFDDGQWQPVVVRDEPVAAALEAQPGPSVHRIMELRPRAVSEPQPGHFVFDLGQNMVGWARLRVKGPAGTRVTLRFAEMLNPDGSIYTANLRGARATDSYILRGEGLESWEPQFTYHGFRYVELTGYPGRPGPDAVTGVVVHSDTPRRGWFKCSNELVNQLYRNIVWGQRGNFVEVPTDCPQRDERLGWMGDAQVFAATACWNMDVETFFRQWMRQVRDAQTEEGAFTDVAPRVAAGAGTAAWGDAGVIVPWTVYRMYGDRRILERSYPAMQRWVEYLKSHSKGLLRPASGYGDWLSVRADTPKDVLATAWFARSVEVTAKVARVLGRENEARAYDGLHSDIAAAFNKAYVSSDGRIKGDTQTVYLLALSFDLLPPQVRERTFQRLVDDIRRRDWHLSTGFVGVRELCPTLTRFGRTDVAYRLLLNETFPSWGYSIRCGATTIWERWDGWTRDKGFQNPGMNSFNHYAFGSVGQWLFEIVVGMQVEDNRPGFQHFTIAPQPGGSLTWARSRHESPFGPIVSNWRIADGKFHLDVRVPPNTTADVVVPSSRPSSLTEGGRPVREQPGVRSVRTGPGKAIVEVGSGDYSFAAPAPS